MAKNMSKNTREGKSAAHRRMQAKPKEENKNETNIDQFECPRQGHDICKLGTNITFYSSVIKHDDHFFPFRYILTNQTQPKISAANCYHPFHQLHSLPTKIFCHLQNAASE